MSDTPTNTKILVIDDDSIILMQVEKILNDNHYAVISADNGPAGLEKAETENPDLILLDRRMPHMDGSTVLTKLKNSDNTSRIPVIMLTGDNKIEDVSENLELGAVDYIVKPFATETFLVRLEKALKSA